MVQKLLDFSLIQDLITNEISNIYFINFFIPIFNVNTTINIDEILFSVSQNTTLYYLNFSNFNAFITFSEFMSLLRDFLYSSLAIILNQLTYYSYLFYEIDLNNIYVSLDSYSWTFYVEFWNVFLFFIIFTLALAIFNYYYQAVVIITKKVLNFFYFYKKFLLVWVNFISIKFESYEESLTTFIFWPWCIFLIFTHLVEIENQEVFFIFIEWGLPIIYGFILISEYIFNFGKYIYIYLNGAKGRSIFIITLLEDFVAFSIIFARVSLQVIRGILCGFFHDFFRELSDFIFDVWEYFWNYIQWELPFRQTSFSSDLFYFFIEWYAIVFSLLFAYVILFLQLLFLFIAVWLFCKCWFISNKKLINIFK